MMLTYYNKTKNFGDMLNPLIFNHHLPGFFDNNQETLFLGIGTILGLEKGLNSTNRIIVFSSGVGFGDTFTYGELPVLDSRYDILCLRGPLTAKKLRIDPSLAISDGALLLRNMHIPEQPKKYRFAYIPHHVSEGMFPNWREIADDAGIHFISPQKNVIEIIQEIQQSEIIITEAMHGAIIADVFRVPWIPVKAYSHINEFKWQDWGLTLNLDIKFQHLSSLFSQQKIKEMIHSSMSQSWQKPFTGIAEHIYKNMHDRFRRKKVIKELMQIKQSIPILSKEKDLNNRVMELVEKIDMVKEKYQENKKSNISG